MNSPNINDKEIKAHKHAQIYTLAHAVRSKKKFPDRTSPAKCLSQCTPKNASSPKIKEDSKNCVKSTTLRQPRSHLPMNMIVSKMATRKRCDDENKDPANKLDLSLYRKYPLEPPPWRNVLCSTRRQRPSELDKIVSNMKKKRSELDSSSRHNNSTVLKDQTTIDYKKVQSLLLNGNPQDCTVMDTPRLEYNYNQLYGGHQRKRTTDMPVVFLDEDPLSIDITDQQTLGEDHSRSPTPESLSQVVPDVGEPDFVWNPVIVYKPKTQLFDCEETVSLEQLCTSPYKEQEDHPSYFNTPACESSSTSSDHIVTEERIQLTIFAKQGNLSMFGHDYLRRSPQNPNDSWD